MANDLYLSINELQNILMTMDTELARSDWNDSVGRSFHNYIDQVKQELSYLEWECRRAEETYDQAFFEKAESHRSQLNAYLNEFHHLQGR